MPTRKQRKRRAKERRHEYEYVYVDEEGREVEADPAELEAGAATQRKQEAPSKASARRNGARGLRRSAGRPVPPPSWRRVLKRAAIFVPFMFIAISLLGRNLSWTARALQTLWLIALFMPFSYLIDRMMYRRYLRQTGQPPQPPRRRGA